MFATNHQTIEELSQVFQTFKHKAVLALKDVIYGQRGEPYQLGRTTLRFTPGTRPVRTKYRDSENPVSRYDARQVEMVCETLRPGDFAIDIGAHAGQYALMMAALCGPEGRVIAFEPDAHARKKLDRNLALNGETPRPTVEIFALSDRSGTATLYSRGGDSNSSLSLSGLPSSKEADLEKMEVSLCTLDDYLRDHSLPMPKLVKIDTEGAEIRILSGATELLASEAEILCELHPYAWEGFGTGYEVLQGLLADCGRQMRYIDQAGVAVGEPEYGVVLLERRR